MRWSGTAQLPPAALQTVDRLAVQEGPVPAPDGPVSTGSRDFSGQPIGSPPPPQVRAREALRSRSGAPGRRPARRRRMWTRRAQTFRCASLPGLLKTHPKRWVPTPVSPLVVGAVREPPLHAIRRAWAPAVLKGHGVPYATGAGAETVGGKPRPAACAASVEIGYGKPYPNRARGSTCSSRKPFAGRARAPGA